MQKNGAGLHTASSCYWDNTTDGSCTVRYESILSLLLTSFFFYVVGKINIYTQSYLSLAYQFNYLYIYTYIIADLIFILMKFVCSMYLNKK